MNSRKMSPELLIIAALATYRLTFMLNAESGPADVFGRFRTRIGVKYDVNSMAYGTNWLSEGVLCFYCLSVWIGIGLTLWILAWSAVNRADIAFWTLTPFALSGAAILLRNHDSIASHH